MTEPEPTQVDTDDDAPPRDFAAFLLEHAQGRTHHDLSHALRDLVLSVVDTRKAGQLTLTVKIKPQPNIDGAVQVADTVKCTLPEYDRPESIFFATQAGALVRNDPRQTSLFGNTND